MPMEKYNSKNLPTVYEYQEIADKTYLIIEWKSGDYVYGGLITCYYVLEKQK